jgi:hypothetical protein
MERYNLYNVGNLTNYLSNRKSFRTGGRKYYMKNSGLTSSNNKNKIYNATNSDGTVSINSWKRDPYNTMMASPYYNKIYNNSSSNVLSEEEESRLINEEIESRLINEEIEKKARQELVQPNLTQDVNTNNKSNTKRKELIKPVSMYDPKLQFNKFSDITKVPGVILGNIKYMLQQDAARVKYNRERKKYDKERKRKSIIEEYNENDSVYKGVGSVNGMLQTNTQNVIDKYNAKIKEIGIYEDRDVFDLYDILQGDRSFLNYSQDPITLEMYGENLDNLVGNFQQELQEAYNQDLQVESNYKQLYEEAVDKHIDESINDYFIRTQGLDIAEQHNTNAKDNNKKKYKVHQYLEKERKKIVDFIHEALTQYTYAEHGLEEGKVIKDSFKQGSFRKGRKFFLKGTKHVGKSFVVHKFKEELAVLAANLATKSALKLAFHNNYKTVNTNNKEDLTRAKKLLGVNY